MHEKVLPEYRNVISKFLDNGNVSSTQLNEKVISMLGATSNNLTNEVYLDKSQFVNSM